METGASSFACRAPNCRINSAIRFLVSGSNVGLRPRRSAMALRGLLSLAAVCENFQLVLVTTLVSVVTVLYLSPVLLAVDRRDKLRFGTFVL